MKRICIPLLLAVLALAMLSGCKKVTYREDLSAASLGSVVEKHLDSGSLAEMTSGYLSGAMRLDPTMFMDYVVKVNAYGANIDEYGIFRAANQKSLPAVQDAIAGYLKLRRDNWMDEYMPAEKPKLTQAEVKTCGLYVMYAIVADEARQDMLEDFEATLTTLAPR